MEPWGVAVNQRGELVVAEFRGNCVSVFSPHRKKLQSKKLQSFGMHGSSPGKVAYPCEVAVDGEGNILIADCWHIQKFTSEGQFSFLVLLALHSLPVTISRYYNHRVQVLNSDLTLRSSTFGKKGSGKGWFDSILCCDSTGKVYFD